MYFLMEDEKRMKTLSIPTSIWLKFIILLRTPTLSYCNKFIQNSLIIISLFLWAGITNADDNDNEELFNELTSLAEKNYPEAPYHLGMLYNNGIGTKKNINEAFKWFKISAAADDPLGHYKLGCYYAGQAQGVVAINHEKALKHKLIAAESGYAFSQFDVASMYYKNKEVEEAIVWWKKSANQGYPNSIYQLVDIYYEGAGIPKDMALAYQYLKIVEININKKYKPAITAKLEEIEKDLSSAQIEQAQTFVENWVGEPTPLTIRAMSGMKESKRVVESAKGTSK